MSNTYVSKFDAFVIVCDVYVFMFDASMLVLMSKFIYSIFIYV
jgi:hypothetical protein